MDAYEGKINQPGGPELKKASEYVTASGKTGTPSKFRMTKDELLQIVEFAQGKQAMDWVLGKGASRDRAANRKKAEAELAEYMTLAARAFDTMRIDTLEAQALFLAHSAGETIFAKLTEGQTDDTAFESDPAKVKVSTSTAATSGQKYGDGTPVMDGPMRYGQDASPYRSAVDPTRAIDGHDENSFDKTFIGRGTIQVTLRENYLQTLAYMDKRAADLRAEAAAGGDKDKIQKAEELEAASAAIKARPNAAANPKYAFLFSAAFMQMSPMARTSASGFTNSGMTGGHADRQGSKKQKAYQKALEILKAHKAEDDAKATPPGASPLPGRTGDGS